MEKGITRNINRRSQRKQKKKSKIKLVRLKTSNKLNKISSAVENHETIIKKSN